MLTFDPVRIQSELDECDQSHVYQNTGCLSDESHPVSQQVSFIFLIPHPFYRIISCPLFSSVLVKENQS
jgi:hypothetical protein